LKYYFKSLKLDFSNFDYQLSGFSKREESLLFGSSDLYIKGIWFKNNSNLIIISIDILYIPKELSFNIYKYFEKEYNINRSEIIFNATHTHSAPGIDKIFDSTVNLKILTYLENGTKSLFKNIEFENGYLCYKTFPLNNKMWISRRKIGRDIRRFFLVKKTIMLPNTTNEIDEDIRLIVLFDEQHNIKYLIYNFSCHPVFNVANQLSSDFIGTISSQLNKVKSIDSMFLQGFLGDIRPNFVVTSFKNLSFINKLKLLFNKTIFKKYSKEDFNLFCSVISESILKELFSNKLTSINNEAKFVSLEFTFKLFSQTNDSNKDLSTKIVLINKNIFISISAEVNSRYYLELVKEFKDLNIIPLGVADNIIGYLPFFEEVKEGGYEINSYVNYGWDSAISEKSLKEYNSSLHDNIKKLQDNYDYA
jgi:hypothetical protein